MRVRAGPERARRQLSPSARVLPVSDVAIRTEGLCRSYGDLKALDTLDLEIPRGALFGLLGPNGAGKSTTIKILTTLLAPTTGKAFVAGHDVVHHARDVRARTGVVFQDSSLDDRLTARENLALHVAIYGVPSAERARRVGDKLDWVGLASVADHRVRTFSGGMRRRLEVARALTHEPEVLILDEPTVGLDPQTRRSVWEHLGQIAATHERTVFVTTHYMDEAERCDDVAIVDHGKLIARGTPRELIAKAGLERLILKSEDDARTAREAEALGYTAKPSEDGLEVVGGARGDAPEAMLARLAERGLGLREASIVRPRLEDAFVALTGRDIRDEHDQGGGHHEAMKTRLRARGRRA
jgi:ABC-2 type transport system ATP-binding protein